MQGKKRILGVIPARYKSTRFEGKPLVDISGVPMIKRTYLQVVKSRLLDKVIVATEDERIFQYCESENIPVLMTSDKCITGTDRVAEVSEQLEYDFYVNIQGDEPVIDPISIEQVISLYEEHGEEFVAYNLYKVITNNDLINSNTIIKVITNCNDDLMYMSRLPIPFSNNKGRPDFKQQVPVYGFTRNALRIFSASDRTLNERYEDVEMLRFVDLGFRLKMGETTASSISVDIPSDVKRVEDFIKRNDDIVS